MPSVLEQQRPKQLKDVNPKGMRRFGAQLCMTCRKRIMNHYILVFKDPEMRSRWYCRLDGTSYSEGMKT